MPAPWTPCELRFTRTDLVWDAEVTEIEIKPFSGAIVHAASKTTILPAGGKRITLVNKVASPAPKVPTVDEAGLDWGGPAGYEIREWANDYMRPVYRIYPTMADAVLGLDVVGPAGNPVEYESVPQVTRAEFDALAALANVTWVESDEDADALPDNWLAIVLDPL